MELWIHPYTLTGDTIKAMYPQKINGDTMWVSSITISGNKLMLNCWLRFGMPTDKMNNFIDYGSVSILMHAGPEATQTLSFYQCLAFGVFELFFNHERRDF